MKRPIFLFCSLVLINSPAFAMKQTCSGNACNVITIAKANNCIVIRNNSNKIVQVKPRTTFVSFGAIRPSSIYIPKETNPFTPRRSWPCLQSYDYKYTAQFEG